MCYHTCSIDIFVDLQPFGCNFKGGLSIARFGGLGGLRVLGYAHSITHPWLPISFPLTYVVYLLPFLSSLAGSKSISARPPALDKLTIRPTALEATAFVERHKQHTGILVPQRTRITPIPVDRGGRT